MTYTVDRCADCPMLALDDLADRWGTCRPTQCRVKAEGNPPPTCPLRDSAVTIVIREGR